MKEDAESLSEDPPPHPTTGWPGPQPGPWQEKQAANGLQGMMRALSNQPEA